MFRRGSKKMRTRMLASLFVCALSVLLLLACKPSAGKTTNSDPGGVASGSIGSFGSSPNATPTPKPPGYHELGGKIDKQDITVKLTRTGNQFNGTYQYTRIGKDIPIKGTIGADNAVEMTEYGAGGDKTPTGYLK